jgi:phage-related tail fiber protein
MLSAVAPVAAHAAEDNARADATAETPELPRTFIGVTLGARWAFTENLSADLQYRFQCTEKLNLGTSRNYGTSTTHQFNAGMNYNF